MHALDVTPSLKAIGSEIDNAVEGPAARWFITADKGPAYEAPARCERPDRGFIGLLERDGFKPSRWIETAVSTHDRRRNCYLVTIKRIAGMQARGRC
ncbi:MAG TPA: hypothetical protein VMY41_15600 [Thermohalobaculum sp.]|nr:hypothetical protein [Thermohalobaculum sp.]